MPWSLTSATMFTGRSSRAAWSMKYRNDARQAMPSSPATSVESSNTTVSVRFCPCTANISVNTFRPTEYLITWSRSRVVAMTRGVSCALATCSATSSEPNVKTMNERVSVISVWKSAREPSTSSPVRSQGIHRSTNCSRRNVSPLGDDRQDRHHPQRRAQVTGGPVDPVPTQAFAQPCHDVVPEPSTGTRSPAPCWIPTTRRNCHFTLLHPARMRARHAAASAPG